MKDYEFDFKLEDILESDNLAEDMTQEQLDALGAELCYEIDNDEMSRQKWEEGVDKWTELATQVMTQKSYPWPNAANVKYPLLTTAAMNFAARAYAALLPGTNWVKGKVIGEDADGSKRDRAIRVGKHMTYQQMDEMKEWEADMDRLLHALPIVGTAFKKTYYDNTLMRNVSEYVPAKDLIINYAAASLEKAERKTHLLYYSDNEIEERIRAGIYLRTEKELELGRNEPKKTNEDKSQGMSNANGRQMQHELGECHCFIDLDGDGYKEPAIVTIHRKTKQVLRVVARFDERNIKYSPVDEEEIMKIEPTEYFTGYIFIPDPSSGVYGLGFGQLLGPLNETLNSIINQLMDAGTMNNLQSGFVAKNFQLRGGVFKFKPNTWKTVNVLGKDIRDGIFPLPTKEPSAVLFSLLGFLENAGMKLASVTEILTGDIPGQNTKATVALQAIEQGLKVFTSIYKRLHRSYKEECKKQYLLNAEFLAGEEYFNVMDIADGEAETIKNEDYDLESVDVIPYSDPNVSSEQVRLAKVQALLDVLNLGFVNPEVVTRRYLEATDQPGIEEIMTMPEPSGPPPEVILEEKKLMLEQKRIMLDAIKTDAVVLREKAAALKMLAEADATERESRMAELQQVLDEMDRRDQQALAIVQEMAAMGQQQQQPQE